jgi:hypothetical protein
MVDIMAQGVPGAEIQVFGEVEAVYNAYMYGMSK